MDAWFQEASLTHTHAHTLTHLPTLILTDSLTLIAFSASTAMSVFFSPAKRAVRYRLNAFDLRGMASAQRLEHSTESQSTTAHYVRWAVRTPPQPSTLCAERHCLSFASSADAGARRQGCDRALRFRARLRTMRAACTPCANLALASAPPLPSTPRACCGVVIFNKERLRPVFAKILVNWTVLREMNFSRENQTNGTQCLFCSSVPPSVSRSLEKENWLQFLLIFIAVRNPILILFWLAPAKGIVRILERDELN